MSVQTIARLQDKTVNITSNGEHTINPDSGYTAMHSLDVNVDVSLEEKVVFFYDFEGTLVASYTGTEIQALSALPSAPDHSQDDVPLTFDAWNWTLTGIKAYNTKYPEADINVGANYHTTDNKIHLFWKIESGDTTGVKVFVSNLTGNTIEWGDNTTETAAGNTVTHIYSQEGTYHCIINKNNAFPTIDGTSQSASGNSYKLIKARLPGNITAATSEAFYYCYNLESVNLPSSIGNGSIMKIFSYCNKLKFAAIPNNNVNITFAPNCYNLEVLSTPESVYGIYSNSFNGCYNLKSLTLPDGITNPPDCTDCWSLKKIVLPDSVTGGGYYSRCYHLKQAIIHRTSITSLDSQLFCDCYSLNRVTLPSTLTRISSSVFMNCSNLTEVSLPNNITDIGGGAFFKAGLNEVSLPTSLTNLDSNPPFSSCYRLKRVVLPNNLTTVRGFTGCYSLTEIILPDTVTELGNNAFNNCSLEKVTLPASITNLDSYCLSNNKSLRYITVKATTPPTLSNKAFYNDTLSKIYVPYSADHSVLAAYQGETNWSNYASIMEELPE